MGVSPEGFLSESDDINIVVVVTLHTTCQSTGGHVLPESRPGALW